MFYKYMKIFLNLWENVQCWYWLVRVDRGGECCGGRGDGGAAEPDGGEHEQHGGAARARRQGPHDRASAVRGDGEQREDGAGDREVGHEVVERAVNRAEYPVSTQ